MQPAVAVTNDRPISHALLCSARRARESVLHTLHEMDAWMHKYMGPDALLSQPAPVSKAAADAVAEALSTAKL